MVWFIKFPKKLRKVSDFCPIMPNFTIQINQHAIKPTMTTSIIPLFLGNFRGWEWIIIGLIILLLFGGKKIPELMRGLGKGVQSFRKGVQEAREELNRPLDGDDASA